jgi:hypothetical protein
MYPCQVKCDSVNKIAASERIGLRIALRMIEGCSCPLFKGESKVGFGYRRKAQGADLSSGEHAATRHRSASQGQQQADLREV